MLNLVITPGLTDESGFIGLAAQIIHGAVVVDKPDNVIVTKIDHWFDHKWMCFSGKALGAVGVWKKKLTIPPFVANRIVEERHFCRSDIDGNYEPDASCRHIHHRGRAEENFQRTVRQVAPSTSLFWYSGNTAESGRGSLMGYTPVEGDHWPWYLAFVRNGDWRIAHRKGIHEYEVRMFKEAGGRTASGVYSCHQTAEGQSATICPDRV